MRILKLIDSRELLHKKGALAIETALRPSAYDRLICIIWLEKIKGESDGNYFKDRFKLIEVSKNKLEEIKLKLFARGII